MPELRLPITKKQHAQFKGMFDQVNALQSSIGTAGSVIIAGAEEDIPKAEIRGVDDTDGVYQLVLVVPDPPKSE